MSDPVGWLGEAGAKYGPTGVGLLIGTAAKYGLTLSEGKQVTWGGLIADLLLLGMLGLIAILIADYFDLTGNARVLAGALAAVSSDRLVRLARDRFMRRVEDELETTAKASPATFASVPAGKGRPRSMRVEADVADSAKARAGATLKRSFGGSKQKRPPEDQIALLRQLDKEGD